MRQLRLAALLWGAATLWMGCAAPKPKAPAPSSPVLIKPTAVSSAKAVTAKRSAQPSPSTVVAITVGNDFACALTGRGGVLCWGDNRDGELGDGAYVRSPAAVPVRGLSSGVAAISAGHAHACALTGRGGVLCWGSNGLGQLGNNPSSKDRSSHDSAVPVHVVGLSSGVKAIAAGPYHTCALRRDGAVLCWGDNQYGELGNNSREMSKVPVPVATLDSGVVSIGASNGESCAVKSGGHVVCWGDLPYREVTHALKHRSLVPVLAPVSAHVTAVAPGWEQTCVLTERGAVRCWGLDEWGQLGDNSTVSRALAVPVAGLSHGVRAISAGAAYTCALTRKGAALCWGENDENQVGTNAAGHCEQGSGPESCSIVPATVPGLSSGVAAIAAGFDHACALTRSGAVLCWGGMFNRVKKPARVEIFPSDNATGD